jgi:hypothetical protein
MHIFYLDSFFITSQLHTVFPTTAGNIIKLTMLKHPDKAKKIVFCLSSIRLEFGLNQATWAAVVYVYLFTGNSCLTVGFSVVIIVFLQGRVLGNLICHLIFIHDDRGEAKK